MIEIHPGLTTAGEHSIRIFSKCCQHFHFFFCPHFSEEDLFTLLRLNKLSGTIDTITTYIRCNILCDTYRVSRISFHATRHHVSRLLGSIRRQCWSLSTLQRITWTYLYHLRCGLRARPQNKSETFCSTRQILLPVTLTHRGTRISLKTSHFCSELLELPCNVEFRLL